MTRRQMKLGMFMRAPGHHIAAWRLPEAPRAAGSSLAHNVEVAQLAERGLFDMVFWADTAGVWGGDKDELSRLCRVAWIEPFTLLAAFAAVTRHIGLVCTQTTTYDEPFHIARRFASLDVMSGGRAGWNLVTSAQAAEAYNFSRETHMDKTDRYRRAREFAHVVLGLWRSWDDDAFVEDKEAGLFFEPSKLHVLDHKGEFFKVRGPLNVPRSPQGHPVMVQAGASDDGRNLAAETAEVIFAATPTIELGRAFYKDVKARVARFGRNPDHVKILPGVLAYVGRTDAEAQAKHDRLQSLIHPQVGVRQLSNYIAYDLSRFPIDGPLPPIPKTAVSNSRVDLLVEMARRDNLTIRQLYEKIAGGRGHMTLVGSAERIADTLQEWFETGAADGFNYLPPTAPGSLQDFIDLVIPELQKRGLFRTAYEGTTLRENLGLPIPADNAARSSAPSGHRAAGSTSV
jgi:FMN-dependent oxidoreductase (nitrilotriacetate monooxygenase family)